MRGHGAIIVEQAEPRHVEGVDREGGGSVRETRPLGVGFRRIGVEEFGCGSWEVKWPPAVKLECAGLNGVTRIKSSVRHCWFH